MTRWWRMMAAAGVCAVLASGQLGCEFWPAEDGSVDASVDGGGDAVVDDTASAPGELPPNPVVTITENNDGKDCFIWKQPADGAGAICRWPTALYRQYGVTAQNSYVLPNQDPNLRMDFYKIDDDMGAKISYINKSIRTSALPKDMLVVLYKDGAPFAWITVPDPDGHFVGYLPQ